MTSTLHPGAARIPAEVLSLIFVASIPDDVMTEDEFFMFPRPSIHQSPLVLGKVCRLWREISLATPRLWCKIQLGDMKAQRDGYPSPHYRRDLGRDSVTLREWLRRSGNCPLSIGICYEEVNDSDIDSIKKTIEVAILYIRRWKNFTSYLTPPLFTSEVIFSLFEMARPMLESLHILTDDFFDEEWKTSSHLFKPHHITSSMGDSASMTLTGRHSLRRLLITSATISLDQFELCVTHCPLLEKILVTVNNDLSTLTTANPNDTHPLPHLAELDMYSASDCIGQFLDRISCPLLEKLVLAQYLENDAHGTSWPHIGLFLRRSQPPLKHLALTSIPMALNDFLDSFKQAPSLKSLSLDDMEVPDDLFRTLLLSPESNQPLLPTLQNLTVTENLTDISGESLTALVLSRWNCQCPRNYSIGEISDHLPDCQRLQLLNIDEDILGTVDVGAIIEQGFKLVINGKTFPAIWPYESSSDG